MDGILSIGGTPIAAVHDVRFAEIHQSLAGSLSAALDGLAACAKVCAESLAELATVLPTPYKRPGQWGERARKRRAKRLRKAWLARMCKWSLRGTERIYVRNRRRLRALARMSTERRAREVGLVVLPGEPTKALQARIGAKDRLNRLAPIHARLGAKAATGDITDSEREMLGEVRAEADAVEAIVHGDAHG